MTRHFRPLSTCAAALILGSCGLFVEPPEVERTPPPLDAAGEISSRSTAEAGQGGEGNLPGRTCEECGGTTGEGAGNGDPGNDGVGGTDSGEPIECLDACDCDGDGYLSEACGGDDCDDEDPQVHPGQTKYFAQAARNPEIGFDYDCSGTMERDPSQALVDCGLLSLALCQDNQGFEKKLPSCGKEGKWIRCHPGPLKLTCVQEDLSTVVARCR